MCTSFAMGLYWTRHVVPGKRAVEAKDMRKGFEGLYGLSLDKLGLEVQNRHLFLFANATGYGIAREDLKKADLAGL
jgi:hypothetical protein